MNSHHENIALRIVDEGTWTLRPDLEEMAALAAPEAPGAAAALVDWSGSEVARLRAFSVVAATLTRSTSTPDLAELLGHAASTQAA